MSENVQVESFYKYLIANGYYFDKELIYWETECFENVVTLIDKI